MKKIVILTGSELRHTFIRKAIALNNNIEVVKSYCEYSETLREKVQDTENILQKEHLDAREQSEKDFFSSFDLLTPDRSNPVLIKRGDINKEFYINEITSLNPDLIIAYGCSIIKPPLIKYFKNRFLNVHLGLSPYYRGSGTNFFPLVNYEPEFVGATFMFIDEGIDTGDIIHQIRARVYKNDTPHQIGNRLISDIALVYIDLINNFDKLENIDQPTNKKDGKYYTENDFSSETVQKLYDNFSKGLVNDYLLIREEDKAKLFENNVLREIK